MQPSEITDNGQFTALRFPNQRELPAFFAVNSDGGESIVSFDVRDEFVVIHGVFSQLRLRRGKEVLCVFNEAPDFRSEEHTSELQSLMRISYAVFCLKKKKTNLYISIFT